VQPRPAGLCDALFRAAPLIDGDEPVLIGLPDTIWFPENGLARLPDDRFSLLLFPVAEPHLFDSVSCDGEGRVTAVEVKVKNPRSRWVWGALKLPGPAYRGLFELWRERGFADEYLGTLINAWIERGREVWAQQVGEAYYDVGTMDGYLAAMQILMDGAGVSAASGGER
jgi:dTDP-glucose pyrophosphorylase